MKNALKNVHIIAICGTAMASLAGMLKQLGFNVSGSDANVYPPMSTQLQSLGIKIMDGYKAENLSYNPDLVIVGNAITRQNPEAVEMTNRNLPHTSFPKFFSDYILDEKIPIVISGTHGKTTTSSLMAWVLEVAGLNPNFFIGGIPENFAKSYKLDTGKYFVVEGDEYDCAYFDKQPKFMHYKPFLGAITSVEFDHADIYSSLEQIEGEFTKFAKLIPQNGFLSICAQYHNILQIAGSAKCEISTYGVDSKADYTGEILSTNQELMQFNIYHKGELVDKFESTLIGKHNLLNILCVFSIAQKIGINIDAFKKALISFKSVKRRLQIRGIKNNITVIDDFAHHPTAIKETINAAKLKFSGKRIWAIFEPRSNTTRRNIFQNEFPKAFLDADKIILAKIHRLESVEETKRLNIENVISDLVSMKKDAKYIPDTEKIIDEVIENVKSGDIILIMSNGGFENIHERLLNKL